MAQIFISYARKDEESALELQNYLTAQGMSTWFNKDNLDINLDWDAQIQQAIGDCDALIVLMSPDDDDDDENRQREVEAALNANTQVIPIALHGDIKRATEQSNIAELIRGTQIIDAVNKPTVDVADIVRRAVESVMDNVEVKETKKSDDRAPSTEIMTGGESKSDEGDWEAEAVAESEPTSEAGTDTVAFTHFYPAEVAEKSEAPLHVYVHLHSVLQQVKDDFAKRKNFEAVELTDTEVSETFFKRGTVFSIVPTIKNARVIPASMAIEWQDDFEHVQFSIKPQQGTKSGCSGGVRIFVGAACIAELPVIFRVGEADAEESSETRFPYQKIFISYSHKDQQIVKAIDRLYAKHPELETLIDYRNFDAGDDWWEEAKDLIEEAEALQLFWSKHAEESSAVQREWQYAFDLPRPIVPVMLNPKGEIPRRLRHIIFGDYEQLLDKL